jgi:hypothetical protein
VQPEADRSTKRVGSDRPSKRRRLPWGRLIAGALAVAVIALVVSVLSGGRRLPDGPEPVVWNRQACAHCRMAVGEPAHAAQLITTDGDALFFDDPGCLMKYLDDRSPKVHRIWFHAHASERWLSAGDVGFVTGVTTPMGFGLAATDRTASGALTLDQARRWINRAGAGELGDARPLHGESP